MGNRQDDAYIVEVLSDIVTRRGSNQARLAHGAQLRRKIGEAMRSGEPVEHYRLTWMKETVEEVIELLSELAETFDTKYPDDMCSGADLLDVLKVAYLTMEKRLTAKSEAIIPTEGSSHG